MDNTIVTCIECHNTQMGNLELRSVSEQFILPRGKRRCSVMTGCQQLHTNCMRRCYITALYHNLAKIIAINQIRMKLFF